LGGKQTPFVEGLLISSPIWYLLACVEVGINFIQRFLVISNCFAWIYFLDKIGFSREIFLSILFNSSSCFIQQKFFPVLILIERNQGFFDFFRPNGHDPEPLLSLDMAGG
jgi:hypothetical protein